MTNDYDPKLESAKFTAYWQGYDRGFADGKAGGYVMPEPKFTKPEAATPHSDTDAHPENQGSDLFAANAGITVPEGWTVSEITTYGEVLTQEQMDAVAKYHENKKTGWVIPDENAPITPEQARYAYDSALEGPTQAVPCDPRHFAREEVTLWRLSPSKQEFVPALKPARWLHLDGSPRNDSACQ